MSFLPEISPVITKICSNGIYSKSYKCLFYQCKIFKWWHQFFSLLKIVLPCFKRYLVSSLSHWCMWKTLLIVTLLILTLLIVTLIIVTLIIETLIIVTLHIVNSFITTILITTILITTILITLNKSYITHDDITYNIDKCNITLMFLSVVISKVI